MYLADVVGKCSLLIFNRVEDISDPRPKSDPCASSAIRPDIIPLFFSIPHPESAPGQSIEPNTDFFRILGEILAKNSKIDSKVDGRLANVENRLTSVENRLTNVENQLAIFQRFQRDDDPIFGVAPDLPVDGSATPCVYTKMAVVADEAVVEEGELANVLMDMKHEEILPLVVDREHPKRERKNGRLLVSPYTDLAPHKKTTKTVMDPEDGGQLEELKVDMDAAPLSSFHEQTGKRKMTEEDEETGLKKIKVEEEVGIDENYYFEPLTTQEKRRVSSAMAKKIPSDKVLVSMNDLSITVGSFRCLKARGWLDDEVINFYLMVLTERQLREPERYLRCYYFNTFFYILLKNNNDFERARKWVDSNISLVDCDAIFVPIQDSQHWALAIINPKDKKM